MNRDGKGIVSMHRWIYYWPSLFVTIVLLILWETAIQKGWISIIYLAAPTGVVNAFWEMVSSGEIWGHASVSFFRFGSGVAFGAAVGIAVGILTGGYEPFRRSLESLINALYGAPKIALLPLLILLMGIGEMPKVTLIAITAFFSLWINTHTGMRNVDKLLIRVAQNFGANELKVLLKVKLPYILPYIFTGFRLSAGHSLVMVIAAEFLAAKSGLGYLIDEARESYQLERLISLIFLFGGISLFLTRSIGFVEHRWTPWKEKRSR